MSRTENKNEPKQDDIITNVLKNEPEKLNCEKEIPVRIKVKTSYYIEPIKELKLSPDAIFYNGIEIAADSSILMD